METLIFNIIIIVIVVAIAAVVMRLLKVPSDWQLVAILLVLILVALFIWRGGGL